MNTTIQAILSKMSFTTRHYKKGTPFYWTLEMDHAFQQLRTAFCTAPILAHPDFSMPFKITRDASEVGLGAVLSQQKPKVEVVIQFVRKRLSTPESRLIAAEREALVIIWACDSFRAYIIETKYLRETNNQAVSYVTSGKAIGKLVRWELKLPEFHFDIKHRKETSIAHVDAPSRQAVGTDKNWIL